MCQKRTFANRTVNLLGARSGPLDEVLSEALPDEVKDLRLEPSKVASAQAATLKRLAQDAYELDAFRPNLTSADADIRIAMLTAKLKLLGEPPHTL